MSVQENSEVVSKHAYFAGLLDAEGCLQAYAVPCKQIVIEVGMCDRVVIEWIQRHFGGSIRFKDPKRHKKRMRPLWVWRISNESALQVLRLVYPYLICKKREAALLFKFAEVKKQKLEIGSHRWQLQDALLRKITGQIKTLHHPLAGTVETVHDALPLSDDPVQSVR